MHKPTREESALILRELPPDQAFYFHTDVEAPTGISANSLAGFTDSIKTIEAASLEFHMNRGDFEKWIKMLGDETLSQQIANLKQENFHGDKMRKRLQQITRLRLGYLRKLVNTQTT
ncbi:MAG: DUF5752 family protein [Candidatus Bathyarchaeota archaeon]|nr:DUF5752 family protein [Candidatus Bathyarchaeota archaeon]